MKKFDNYVSNLEVLKQADQQDLSNEFIRSGIADKFSLQFELAWKLLKALLRYEGDPLGDTGSPRDVLKGAYRCFDFVDESLWLSMLSCRNTLAHTYDEEALLRIIDEILHRFIPAFIELQIAVEGRYGEELSNIE